MKAAENFLAAIAGPVKAYIDFLRASPGGEEIQYRTPLENLINAVRLPGRNFQAVQEDRRGGVEVAGIPDFFIYEDDKTLLKRLVGFIECKRPSYRLEKLIESEQIKKYARSCENIIITNYSRFILLQKNRVVCDFVLSKDQTSIMDFANLFLEFYQYEYPYINNKKTLAKTLAAQSFYYSAALREFMSLRENKADSFYIKFNGLFDEYQKSINYHYELPDFCDVYSQSLVYGLMLARIDTGKNLNEQDIEYLRLIPAEYTLLIEFLSQGYESRGLPPSIKIALTGIGKNINLINIEAVKNEFAKTNAGKQSISVYLYEDFLTEYDKLRGTENRKEGGVYYTPREAAGFIIRAVNGMLQQKFDLKDGFWAKNVKTLDFACGTGTFLHSIFEFLLPPGTDDLHRQAAKEKILKDIYGFEILFTPYIIAHTLLTKFLADNKIHFENKERLGVYLTNTLDITSHSISALLPRLKLEHDKAMLVKGEEEILAIVGNPPYFGGKSRANSDIIDGLLSDYKKNLEGETNLQPLDDIYIKFIRFAQWKIEKSGKGVVGIITNNSFLDGLVHRQMRKYLYETFDELYILNLHGNSQKKEGCKSIFDIRIGVAILIFVKLPRAAGAVGASISAAARNNAAAKKVYYCSTLGKKIISRQAKLDFLEKNSLTSLDWVELHPEETKNYWFVKKDFSNEKTYKKFISVINIFKEYSSGIACGRDNFCVKYSREALDRFREELSTAEAHSIRKKYDVTDNRDWSLKIAMEDIINAYNPICLHYRPFDYRYTSLCKLSARFLELPRYEVMRHFDNRENIGLSFVRQFSDAKPYTNVLVSQCPIEKRANYSFQGGAYFAPLYLYGENIDGEHPGEIARIPNWTKNFQKNYLASLDWQPEPEEIFAYMYAVLSSPVYRAKYIEFLKTDYPALPMTKNKTVFYQYAGLGQRLVSLHLLKDIPDDASVKVTLGETYGSFVIEKMTFANNAIHLSVIPANESSRGGDISFSGVSGAVFDFEIGSRKPIDLWLKNRIKDAVPLATDDIQHIKNMIIVVKQTIAVMEHIGQLGESFLP